MTVTIAPAETDILTALRAFLLSVAPGAEVVQGQANRVPPPPGTAYIVMWPIARPRLATNFDAYVDTAFTASIVDAVMTVTALALGRIKAGASLFGVDVAAGSLVQSQLSGSPGGVGTYQVSPPQNVSAQTVASGDIEAMQATEVIVQCDVHAADLAAAGDIAASIGTMFRDDYAAGVLAESNPAIAPFYADTPRQVPFINDQQQVETRWSIDLHLQVNQTVSGLPQQFAETVLIGLVDVDAVYPP